jgi:hypothetical protein
MSKRGLAGTWQGRVGGQTEGAGARHDLRGPFSDRSCETPARSWGKGGAKQLGQAPTASRQLPANLSPASRWSLAAQVSRVMALLILAEVQPRLRHRRQLRRRRRGPTQRQVTATPPASWHSTMPAQPSERHRQRATRICTDLGQQTNTAPSNSDSRTNEAEFCRIWCSHKTDQRHAMCATRRMMFGLLSHCPGPPYPLHMHRTRMHRQTSLTYPTIKWIELRGPTR